MIAYVDTRLTEWAEWSRMRIDGHYGIGGIGFDYDEPMPSQRLGYMTFSGPWHQRCIETEEAVAWVRLENFQIGECTIVHYRDHPNWSANLQADFLRMSLRTYWRRLETGHAMLLCHFFDRALSLVPQTEVLRLERRRQAA